MIKRMIDKLKGLVKEKELDLSKFNDALALRIDWTPAKRGGCNFRTHKLLEVDSNKYEFRSSIGAILFYGLFFIIGLGLIISVLYNIAFVSTISNSKELFFQSIGGLAFAGFGGFMLYYGTCPIVFDKRSSFFYKGRKAPSNYHEGRNQKHFCSLNNIHAFQLISEFCQTNKSTYTSYELNIILKDGRRINVVDHGSETKIRQNARTLARFIGVPVWDAI